METVLFFHKLDTSAGRLRLEGLSAFAREAGWNIHCHSDPVDADDLQELIDYWRPAGSVLSTNDGHTEYNADLFSPETTVLQDCYPPSLQEEYAIVSTDSAATAQLAMKELIRQECATYAFAPWPAKRVWSENRGAQFMALAKRHGLNACVFNIDYSKPVPSLAELGRSCTEWLKTLKRPIGLMTANDIIGMHVLAACRAAGIEVPFECRIVGVDNDTAICNMTNPSLSSVELDFRTAGYRAGQILHQLITRQTREKPSVVIPPLGFVRRGSSRVFLQTDRAALQAAELILAKACEGLQAKDVLATFNCSRRLAEMRFRKATGRSVLEEIRAVRLREAMRLLSDPSREISAVANMCGYDSATTFCRIFKQETGMTMSEWRKAARPGA